MQEPVEMFYLLHTYSKLHNVMCSYIKSILYKATFETDTVESKHYCRNVLYTHSFKNYFLLKTNSFNTDNKIHFNHILRGIPYDIKTISHNNTTR